MKALVIPGLGAVTEDGRVIPARQSTETEGVAFAQTIREAVASGRPLVERFDHVYVVEIDRLTDPTTLVDDVRRPRTCRRCGASFEARSATLVYCSVGCRPHPGYRKSEAPGGRVGRPLRTPSIRQVLSDRREQIGPGRRLLAR